MFLKRCTRKNNGKPHTYWHLVESYRTPRGPRHRVVAYLGELDSSERRSWGRFRAPGFGITKKVPGLLT